MDEIELNEFFLEEKARELLAALLDKKADRQTWARNVLSAEDILHETLLARRKNLRNFRILHDITK